MNTSRAVRLPALFHDGPRGVALLGVLPGRDQELLSRPTTFQNCTQYVVLPPPVADETWSRAIADLDKVDLEYLVERCDYVSIRQLLCKPFSIIRLDFETIHRAIGNTGDFHRPVFWIAVKKQGEDFLPEEPLVEVA